MKMKNNSSYTAQKRASKKLKTLSLYVLLFVLWIFTSIFTGRELIYWTVFVMSLVTAFVVYFIPSDRNSTLKVYKGALAGYCLFILMMELFYKVAVNDNDAYIGFIEGFYGFAIFMIPIGYILWQAKKFVHLFGFGKTKREMLDEYKDHGNDGNRTY